MVLITFRFLVIICLRFGVAYSKCQEPWVAPLKYVHDGKSTVEFNCGAHLTAGQKLTWYRGDPGVKTTEIEQTYDGYRTLTFRWLLMLMDSGDRIYCTKSTSGEDIRHELNITFQKNNITQYDPHQADIWGPWLTPETFVDGPVLEIDCWALLEEGDLLTWYHLKESNVTSYLGMVQQEATSGFMKLKLRKTIEPSDNGTQVYCVRAVKKSGESKETQRILVQLERKIKKTLLTPYVIVEPSSTKVIFDEGDELELVCGGSKPVDGRALTWYLQAPELVITIPPVQSYHKSSNKNRLTLAMELAHHQSKLYCAQDFTLKLTNGTVMSYGERARSASITLLHRGLNDSGIYLKKILVPLSPKSSSDDGIHEELRKFLKKSRETYSDFSIFGNKPSICIQKVAFCEMELVKIRPQMVIQKSKCFMGGAAGQHLWMWPTKYVEKDKDMVEFSCGTYLKKGDWLSWYTEGTKEALVSLKQRYDGFRTFTFIWTLNLLKNGDKIYCKKWDNQKDDTWIETPSELKQLDFNASSVTHTDTHGPWQSPKTFVDDDGSVMEFTCWARLNEDDALVWHQLQESNVSTMLVITQVDSEKEYRKIKLRKTLEPSDNGTQICCTKITNTGVVTEGQRISLIFERPILPLETPYVTVEPSTDVVFFDEGEELEFVCGGSEPLDSRALTWYLQAPSLKEDIPPVQIYHKNSNQNRLTLLMEVAYHRSGLYCAQDFTFQFLNGTVISYGERARSKMILVLLRRQCLPGDQPLIDPEKFVENHKSSIQFTCYMFIQPGLILSWYQSKRWASLDDKLLKLSQPLDYGARVGEDVWLTLEMTLEPSDNGSEIYCAQQSVRADGSYSDVLNETERIPLTLTRHIPPLEHAFVTTEPNTKSVYFEVNTSLHFTCSGNKPLDGRNYTWLSKDSEHSVTVPKGQRYDNKTNLNVLKMAVDESHHLTQLVCVQAFLAHIQHRDGSRSLKVYGELAKSRTITLLQLQRQVDQCPEKQATSPCIPEGPSRTLSIVGIALGGTALAVVTVTALVVAAVACCKLCRRPPQPTITSTIKASAQGTCEGLEEPRSPPTRSSPASTTDCDCTCSSRII